MFPFSRSSKKNEPVGNDPDLENVEGEENGGTVEEIGAKAVEEDPNNADDGIFVTETGRKRMTSLSKVLTSAAIGLAIAGFFGTGYGINMAVQHSRVSPSTIGVEEQLPQKYPTNAQTAAEEAVVTEAISEEATEPANLEDEDMPMPQIEEEEQAIIDELFETGAELSMDYGVEEASRGSKSDNGSKSGKGSKSDNGSKSGKGSKSDNGSKSGKSKSFKSGKGVKSGGNGGSAKSVKSYKSGKGGSKSGKGVKSGGNGGSAKSVKSFKSYKSGKGGSKSGKGVKSGRNNLSMRSLEAIDMFRFD